MITLHCKKIVVAKYKGVKAGWPNSQECTSLAETSKDGYDSKRDVLPMMMMMMMMIVIITTTIIFTYHLVPRHVSVFILIIFRWSQFTNKI
jgi:hypothetical protein